MIGVGYCIRIDGQLQEDVQYYQIVAMIAVVEFLPTAMVKLWRVVVLLCFMVEMVA